MTNYYQQLYDGDQSDKGKKGRRKANPGCLIIFFVIFLFCGVSYLFLTAQPSQREGQNGFSRTRIYGELSDAQEEAFYQLSEISDREIELQEVGGSIRAVLLDVDMGYADDPEKQVQAFMQAYQHLYQIKEFDNQFILTDQYITEDENIVLKYSQMVESIPVYSSQLVVVLDRTGSIKLVSGGYLPVKHLWFDPKLTYDKTEIVEILYDQGYSIDSDEAKIELVLFNGTVLGHVEGETELAWVMDIFYQNELNLAVVSAKTGEFLILSPKIKFYNHQLYDADNFPLLSIDGESEEEIVDGCHILWQSIKPLYVTHEESRLDVGQQINYLLKNIDNTLSIYEDHLGWRGYDNKDSHFSVLINVDYESPFYLDHCGSVFIGFVDNASIITSEDIFTHEFQHAVTDARVSGLLNSAATAEAAALDEAYSDIFTALVDTKNPWQIHWGEKLVRDMKKPESVSGQVSHFDNFKIPSRKSDKNSYSHQNSTIISHAAYLIAEGGHQRGIRVDGLGIGNMTRIFFDSQDYLPYNATFFLARWSVIKACEDYYQNSDIKKCDDVRNAFAIVGIGDPAPRPSLLDQLSEIINAIQDEVFNARMMLLGALIEKVQEMGIQVDDFLTRMETDLINLLMELVIKLLISYMQTFLESIFNNICGSLVLVLVLPGTTFIFVQKRSFKI